MAQYYYFPTYKQAQLYVLANSSSDLSFSEPKRAINIDEKWGPSEFYYVIKLNRVNT